MRKNPTKANSPRFVFFGTLPLAPAVLDELEKAGFSPALIVASQDKRLRSDAIEFPPEKSWALSRGIKVIQPETIDDAFISKLKAERWQFFIVASYGKILARTVLAIPERGTLNVHPSLLPRLRGASPIRSAILNDEKEAGVTILLMDEKMDHGPLLAQKKVALDDWPPRGSVLDESLAREGGRLLAQTLPKWLAGEIEPQEQDHAQATFCKLFKKEDGRIDVRDDAYKNLLKIRAYEGWPGAFTFFERNGKKIRVLILEAHVENGTLSIDTVKPEGKNEMSYEEFLRSGAKEIH